ncbi:hypothetical protein TNCV_1496311 [Trichonephila clavipes]|nr:hypothetical protein TNCV_1496311 [Trichonephila clavipes]
MDWSTVLKCLEALRMIQKQGHWVPYELKSRNIERRFLTRELLLKWLKKERFLLKRNVTGDEKWTHHQHRPQNQISIVQSFSAFAGISRM